MFVDCPALDTSTKATPQLPAAEQHALIKPQTPNTPVCCRSPGAWTEPRAVTRRVQSGARASVKWTVSPTPERASAAERTAPGVPGTGRGCGTWRFVQMFREQTYPSAQAGEGRRKAGPRVCPLKATRCHTSDWTCGLGQI